MPDIRENRAKVKSPTVAEVAGFKGILANPPDFPAGIHEQVKRAVVLMSRGMEKYDPSGIEAVFAYSPASWKRAIREVELTAISTVSQWKTMDWIASIPSEEDVIEPAFTIHPVSFEDWKVSVEQEGPSYRRARGRGILVYSTEDDSQGPNIYRRFR